MRILFVSNLYPPNVVGGYERLCFEVASEFVSRKHTVVVLTSTYGGRTASYGGQHVERSLRLLTGETIYAPFDGDDAAREEINQTNTSILLDILRRKSPDIVFCWNLFFLDASFLYALTASGTPVVAMLTDNWLANMIDPQFVASFFRDSVFGDKAFPPPPVITRKGLIERLFGPSRQRVSARPGPHRLTMYAVFGSNFMQTFYQEGGFSFLEGRVIHNGVAQEIPDTNLLPDRTKPIVRNEFRLLFAGRLVDLKGADTVVEALGLLAQTTARLTIVGDEQDLVYTERLRVTISASPVASRVTFEQPVRSDALLSLFNTHDVYVFPSLYEPFSLTLIHALACGIPTIASRAGGNVEIVEEGVSGLLFDKRDAAGLAAGLDLLLADGELRARLARGGRQSASNFTKTRMIGLMEAYLFDVARRG